MEAAADYLDDPISAAWVPKNPSLSPGTRVFEVDFDAAVDGYGLRSAQPSGWRYFLLEGDSGVSAAIHVAAIEGTPRVTHVSHHDDVVRTVEAMTRVEDESGDEEIEVRILSAQELYFEALWAVGQTRAWLIPIEPATTKHALVPSMSEDAMEAYLAGLAAKRLAAGAAPPPTLPDTPS
ncbi:MAG TPA: hypothetical protein VF432_04675 [Thermoanaerobaculia bacterium]